MNSANDDYIRLAYQSALEDIRFFKSQQFTVTNYTILIYGALIAAARLVEHNGNEWLCYITGFVAALSVFVVIQLHCSAQNARGRKKAVENKVPKTMIPLLFKEPSSRCCEKLDECGVTVLLIAVIVVGCILSLWILSRSSCSQPLKTVLWPWNG